VSINTIKPKLAKLILLLGSDQPNEVVAAARAMTRLLASEKHDWHDMVKVFLVSEPDLPPRPPLRQSKANGSQGDWRLSQKGNWWRKMNGYSMTVFKSQSQYRKADWAVVIVDQDDDKTYLNDFESIEEAKAAAESYVRDLDDLDRPPF
jgi:hypothetical protein